MTCTLFIEPLFLSTVCQTFAGMPSTYKSGGGGSTSSIFEVLWWWHSVKEHKPWDGTNHVTLLGGRVDDERNVQSRERDERPLLQK